LAKFNGSFFLQLWVSANCSATSINNYTSAQFSTSSRNSTISNSVRMGFGFKITPNPVGGEAAVVIIWCQVVEQFIVLVNGHLGSIYARLL
jgi:hypothetical protein